MIYCISVIHVQGSEIQAGEIRPHTEATSCCKQGWQGEQQSSAVFLRTKNLLYNRSLVICSDLKQRYACDFTAFNRLPKGLNGNVSRRVNAGTGIDDAGGIGKAGPPEISVQYL